MIPNYYEIVTNIITGVIGSIIASIIFLRLRKYFISKNENSLDEDSNDDVPDEKLELKEKQDILKERK